MSGDRIAEQDSILLIPKLNGIPEAFFLRICVQQLPAMAAIGRLVDTAQFPRPGGHDDCGIGIPSPDSAEVQPFGPGRDGAGLPEVAAILGTKNCAIGSACPRYSF